jgi:hypothetical protein
MISLSVGTKIAPAEYSVEQLDLLCTNSITEIDKLRLHNEEIIKRMHSCTNTQTDMYYAVGYSHSLKRSKEASLHSFCSMVQNYSYNVYTHNRTAEPFASIDVAHVITDTKYLSTLVDKAKTFQRKLHKNILKSGDWFAMVEVNKVNKYNNSVIGTQLTLMCIPDMVVCPNCNNEIGMKSLAYHQKTIRCKNDTRRKEIKEQGYVYTSRGSKLSNLVKRGKIDGELLAIDYEAFVPKWVYEAEKKFNEIAQDGKYAGLGLMEFINKMSADKG